MILVFITLCMAIGYLEYENSQLKSDIKKAQKTQEEILWLCRANKNTQKKVSNALMISNSPASLESFKSVLDELFKDYDEVNGKGEGEGHEK